MELWIRSQDKKTLVKSDYITIIWSPFHYSIVGYLNGKIKHKILGSYKTQKRAIEILDEIQKLLKTAELNDDINVIVYQIPEN